MANDLEKAFEVENGVISDGAVLFESIFSKITSFKPTYSGDDLSKVEYYKSMTQIDANRLLKIDFTYTAGNLTQELWTFYKIDGVTEFNTQTVDHTYVDNNLTKSESTET